MANMIYYFICFLVLLSTLQSIEGISYHVINKAPETNGGKDFALLLDDGGWIEIMQRATEYTLLLFKQSAGRDDVKKITLIVEEPENNVSYARGEIWIDTIVVEALKGKHTKKITRITGIIYEGVAHSLQWDENGQTPKALHMGIAAFVRLKAGYAPDDWKKQGEGDTWYESVGVTAHFLDYCNNLKKKGPFFNKHKFFVAELNSSLRNESKIDFFTEIFKKNVDDLWKDYKKYSAKKRRG